LERDFASSIPRRAFVLRTSQSHRVWCDETISRERDATERNYPDGNSGKKPVRLKRLRVIAGGLVTARAYQKNAPFLRGTLSFLRLFASIDLRRIFCNLRFQVTVFLFAVVAYVVPTTAEKDVILEEVAGFTFHYFSVAAAAFAGFPLKLPHP
jgi:hypothetical protein